MTHLGRVILLELPVRSDDGELARLRIARGFDQVAGQRLRSEAEIGRESFIHGRSQLWFARGQQRLKVQMIAD